METDERLTSYASQLDVAWYPGEEAPWLTPAQRRRKDRKRSSRKTHSHVPGERCLRCRPLPEDVPQLIRPGAGPRDWFQGRPLSVPWARGNGRSRRVGPAPVQIMDEVARFSAGDRLRVRAKGEILPSSATLTVG